MLIITAITLKNEEEPRLITIINGLPFYQSSGSNSGSTNTWFPCCGLANTGLILKPMYPAIAPDIRVEVKRLHLQFQQTITEQEYSLLNNEFARFGNTESILISSVLGGGIWKRPIGKELKKYLQKMYPLFYSYCPDYEIQISSIELNIPAQVTDANQWLLTQAGAQSTNTFTNKLNASGEYDQPDAQVAEVIEAIKKPNANQNALNLLRTGSINIYRTYNLETLCETAIQHQRVDVIEILLEQSEDVNSLFIENKGLYELKRFIFELKDEEFAKKLINKKLEITNTDLVQLIRKDNDVITIMFIEHTDKQMLNSFYMGYNPLREAVTQGKLNLVEKLIACGAAPNVKSSLAFVKFPNIVTLALDKNFTEIARALVKNGAETNHPLAKSLLNEPEPDGFIATLN